MTHSGDNNYTRSAQDFDNYIPTVAYTLGDQQVVRSTYIAHDPYFFMDVDDVTLEEELLAEFDREFSALSTARDEDDHERMLNILSNFDDNLTFAHGEIIPAAGLQRILKTLSKSRYAASLIEFANVNHIEFISAPAICMVEYNRAENIILFQPALNEMDLMKGLIVALRQAWQNHQGALLQPVALYPDHAVFVNRAQRADLAISLVRIGWELELAGHTKLWDELQNSSMRDLTHSFARESVTDFRSLNNGRAAMVTFESWFLSDRAHAADNALIQKMLSDYHGHQFEDEDMSQLVMIDLIKALGEMPYGKNYLAHYIPNLLTDPIFIEVRERAAANFLWFIKFEKTFNEVEQSLQNELPHTSATFPSQGSPDILEGADDANLSQQTGILIPFPQIARSEGDKFAMHYAKDGGGQVIPFDITVRPFNGNFLS